MPTAIPPDDVRAIWRALVAVPGLSPLSIAPDDADGASPATLVARMKGWSPTLHACDITWRVRIPAGSDRFADDFLSSVAPLLALQHARADAGIASGFGLPADGRSRLAAVTHLHADASHLGINILNQIRRAADWEDDEEREEHGVPAFDMPNVLKGIASTLSVAHCGDDPYDGGPILYQSGCLAFERDGLRLVGISGASLDIDRRRQASIARTTTGECVLRLSEIDLPSSVMAALPGRRVGDIAAFHPLLDARRITSAEVKGINLTLGLEALDAPLAVLSGMTPVEAVEHLQAFVAASDLPLAA